MVYTWYYAHLSIGMFFYFNGANIYIRNKDNYILKINCTTFYSCLDTESRRTFSFGGAMMTSSKLQRKITRQMTISGDSAVSSGKLRGKWPFSGDSAVSSGKLQSLSIPVLLLYSIFMYVLYILWHIVHNRGSQFS